MTNKVVIPKEVAEAIEEAWEINKHEMRVKKHLYLTNWNLLKNECNINEYNILVKYAGENPIVYMEALVNGYEIEQTPEDKIKEMYLASIRNEKDAILRNDKTDAHFYMGKYAAIPQVLDLLNIKIEGVNA